MAAAPRRGRLQDLGADPGGDGQLLVPRGLQPADPRVQIGRLGVGRLREPGLVGAGSGQRPEGLLGLVPGAGHLPLGAGQHLGEVVERPGDLPEGRAGGAQVRGELGHPARNRSPSLPTQPPESSPPRDAAASPATEANRP